MNAYGWVYFIKPVGMDGPVKIGWTGSDVARRLVGMQGNSPFLLEIIAHYPGDRVLERRIHSHLIDLHDRCEWFRAGTKLQQMIDAINERRFDISTLPDPICVQRRVNGHYRPDAYSKKPRGAPA